MSQAELTYPLYTPQEDDWSVREDNDTPETQLIRLSDAINERLSKAEALSRVVQSSHEAQDENTHANAAWAIADLIQEARVLHQEQWQHIGKQKKR